MERETGFEPATPSLEGWRSTAELFPPIRKSLPAQVVGRGGFEPPKAYASRFTVCPLWPLGYLPEPTGMMSRNPSESNNSWLALAGGFEPPTHCLQGSCSSPELRQHRENFTLVSSLRSVKEFSPGMSLPDILVTDHRGSRRHVEGTDPPEHRHGQQDVASSLDERPEPSPFASENETERAGQIRVPGGNPTGHGGSVNPNSGLLELFERRCQVRFARDFDRIDGPHRSPGRGTREPDLMVLGY